MKNTQIEAVLKIDLIEDNIFNIDNSSCIEEYRRGILARPA